MARCHVSGSAPAVMKRRDVEALLDDARCFRPISPMVELDVHEDKVRPKPFGVGDRAGNSHRPADRIVPERR